MNKDGILLEYERKKRYLALSGEEKLNYTIKHFYNEVHRNTSNKIRKGLKINNQQMVIESLHSKLYKDDYVDCSEELNTLTVWFHEAFHALQRNDGIQYIQLLEAVLPQYQRERRIHCISQIHDLLHLLYDGYTMQYHYENHHIDDLLFLSSLFDDQAMYVITYTITLNLSTYPIENITD